MKAAAGKALEIDPTLAEAQAILATVEARFGWNWSGAEQRFRRAIALSPRSPAAHVGLALSVLLPCAASTQHWPNAASPSTSTPVRTDRLLHPWVHIFQGKADLAMAELRKLQEDQPASPAFGGGIAIAAVHAGHVAEVISLSEKMEPDPARRLGQSPAQLGFLAYAYGRAGRTSDAAGIERHFKDLSRTGYVPRAPSASSTSAWTACPRLAPPPSSRFTSTALTFSIWQSTRCSRRCVPIRNSQPY